MNDLTSTKIDFLKKLGTENTEHSGGTLLDHLIGVSNILEEMGAPQHVQDAGLFHSIYGTAVFHHQTTADRSVVKSVIGEKKRNTLHIYFVFLEERQTDKQKYHR